MFTLDSLKLGSKFRITKEQAKYNDMPQDAVYTVSLCNWNSSRGWHTVLENKIGVFATDERGEQGIHYLTEIVEILTD